MDALLTNKHSGSLDAIYNMIEHDVRFFSEFWYTTLAAISTALLATPVSLNAIVVNTNGKIGDVACNRTMVIAIGLSKRFPSFHITYHLMHG